MPIDRVKMLAGSRPPELPAGRSAEIASGQSAELPPSRSHEELWVCELGTVSYGDALELQHEVRERRQAGEAPDTLLLLEHPPVYTYGRRTQAGELPFGEDHYRARGIEVVETDRGGRVTYHGPGQLVGYPIMLVPDISVHLRRIEASIIAALAELGIPAHSRCAEGPDYTGVWVGIAEQERAGSARPQTTARKIASIGVHVSRGISTHGFAINADMDLDPFDWVVPCGLPEVQMTSMARELPPGRTFDAGALRASVTARLCEAHGRRARAVSPDRLGRSSRWAGFGDHAAEPVPA
jgi:lipoyl(octanoyl) transferase